MRNFGYWVRRIGCAACVTVAAGGCSGLGGAGQPQGGSTTGAPITITQDVPASALLVVTSEPSSAAPLAGLVTATARPNEEVRIVAPGTPAETVVAADAPAPVTIALAGPPAPPGKGATAYQQAQYARKLKTWQAQRAADVEAQAAQTHNLVAAWVSGLAIGAKVRQLGNPPADAGSLGAESAMAASAQTGLAEGAGGTFGTRKVVILFCNSLGGELPAGELTGDDVIVVTSYLASAADTSAAQAAVLEAGAAEAAVVGPLVTAGQLEALVSEGLAGAGGGGPARAAVLFGNGSYALSAAAERTLSALAPRLKEAGATGVINGFASTPGTATANYLLSFERATAVAKLFEAHGIAASSLVIVGHGASDLVGAGDSAANRRVLVVIEEAGR